MSSVCPNCGFGQFEALGGCEACGHGSVPTVLALKDRAGTIVLSVRMINLAVGARNLGKFQPPDELRGCAASDQFRVERSLENRIWMISQGGAALNPTWLNGSPVPSTPVPLRAGDVISIKGKVMFLTVEMLP